MDDIKQAVLEALKEEGYEAELEDDGDISFEAGEEIFYVCFSDDEDDQEYFRMIWLSDSFEAERRAELLDRLNELTLSFRVMMRLSRISTAITIQLTTTPSSNSMGPMEKTVSTFICSTISSANLSTKTTSPALRVYVRVIS